MNLSQIVLNRYILETLKKDKKPSLSNEEKVDLDYLVNYWDNIISEIEKEIKKKPNIRGVTFKFNVEFVYTKRFDALGNIKPVPAMFKKEEGVK